MGQIMATDDPGAALEETQQSTQEATQRTTADDGLSSQQERARRCWGFLQPCSRALVRADFEKSHLSYTIGRGSEMNIRLKGNKVSKYTPRS
jgi:hypothetical protein